jgi:hypothetical protein
VEVYILARLHEIGEFLSAGFSAEMAGYSDFCFGLRLARPYLPKQALALNRIEGTRATPVSS